MRRKEKNKEEKKISWSLIECGNKENGEGNG